MVTKKNKPRPKSYKIIYVWCQFCEITNLAIIAKVTDDERARIRETPCPKCHEKVLEKHKIKF